MKNRRILQIFVSIVILTVIGITPIFDLGVEDSHSKENLVESDFVIPKGSSSEPWLEWEEYIGTGSNELGNAIWGNESHVYTAGWSGSTTNAYITKSDSEGNLIWTRTWGGGSWEKAWDIVGDDEYIYVCGETISYASSGSYSDFVLLKYHANGTLMWYKTWGGSYIDKAFGIFLNGSDLFLIGDTRSSTSVDTINNALLKYDTDGNFQWAKYFSGPLRDSGDGVFVDGEHIYTGGVTKSYGAGDLDLLLVKWDADGNVLWNRTWGGVNTDWVSGIWFKDSNVYMSGLTQSFGSGGEDSVIIKWDENGNQIWNRTMGTSGNDRFYEVYGDETGIYTGGQLYDTTHGDLDAIVTKWSFDGDYIWNKTWGGSNEDIIRGIVHIEGNLYATGTTSSYGSGGGDVLLLKWDLIFIPDAPELEAIIPNPDTDGNVLLNWNDIDGANSYKVYRDTVPIVDITGMTYISETTQSNYNDLGLASGTYYYVVTTIGSGGESGLSNGREVIVEIPRTIPGYNVGILLGIMGFISLMFLLKKKWKYSISK